MLRKSGLFVPVALMLSTGFCPAQSTVDMGSTPGVTLVLSGGSQNCLTFVELLRWCERERVAIKNIVGTSGGALIGSMYAAGYTPDEINQVLRGISRGTLIGTSPTRKPDPWVLNGGDRGRPTPTNARVNWATFLGTEVPYEFRRLDDKRDAQDYQFRLKMGGGKLDSFSQAPQVGLLLSRVALSHDRSSGAPFAPGGIRLVTLATEMEKGIAAYHENPAYAAENNPYRTAFQSGSLAVALRTTMAIPAIFAPIRASVEEVNSTSENASESYRNRAGLLLTDGGVFEAYPFETAFSTFNLDPIIGGNVQPTPPLPDSIKKNLISHKPLADADPEKVASAGMLDQFGHLLKVIGKANQKRSYERFSHLASATHFIFNATAGGWSDFEKNQMNAATFLADKKAAELQKQLIPLSEEQYSEYQAARRLARERATAFNPTDAIVRLIKDDGTVIVSDRNSAQGKTGQIRQVILDRVLDGTRFGTVDGVIHVTKPIAILERLMLAEIAANSWGHGLYERVGRDQILVSFYESPATESPLKIGTKFVQASTGSRDSDLKLKSIRQTANLKQSFLVGAGDGLFVGSESVFRIAHKMRVGFAADWMSENRPEYRGGSRVAETSRRAFRGDFFYNLRLDIDKELRAGVTLENRNASLRTGTPNFAAETFDGNAASAYLRATYSSTDHPIRPGRGFELDAELRHFSKAVGTSQRFTQATARAFYAQPVKVPVNVLSLALPASLFVQGEFGQSTDSRVGDHQFDLGGPGRLATRSPYEFLGHQYSYGKVGLRLPVAAPAPDFVGRIDLILAIESGTVWKRGLPKMADSGLLFGAQLADTILGSFEFGISTNRSLSRPRAFMAMGIRF